MQKYLLTQGDIKLLFLLGEPGLNHVSEDCALILGKQTGGMYALNSYEWHFAYCSGYNPSLCETVPGKK